MLAALIAAAVLPQSMPDTASVNLCLTSQEVIPVLCEQALAGNITPRQREAVEARLAQHQPRRRGLAETLGDALIATDPNRNETRVWVGRTPYTVTTTTSRDGRRSTVTIR